MQYFSQRLKMQNESRWRSFSAKKVYNKQAAYFTDDLSHFHADLKSNCSFCVSATCEIKIQESHTKREMFRYYCQIKLAAKISILILAKSGKNTTLR